jgi:hypothetical protein
MDPAPRPYLPVEPLFDRIIEGAGGVRVDALLGKVPDWENADYVFQETKVVVELKEIQTDINADRELSERIGAIHYKHRARLGVLFGRQSIRIDKLPDDIRNEMVVPFQRRIEGPIKKAARQLKETKAKLGLSEGCGILVVVNDASTFLTPDVAHFFFSRILAGQHSAIDLVVYCSVNMLLHSEGVPEGGCFWWAMPVPGRRTPPDGFVEKLCANWKREIDEAVGVAGGEKHFSPDLSDSGATRFAALPNGGADSPFFVRPKRFYNDPVLGFRYYCDHVVNGTARMFLVESYQGGQLVQAEFDQKLIYATRDAYREIEDRGEIERLQAMLKRLRKKEAGDVNKPVDVLPEDMLNNPSPWAGARVAVLVGAVCSSACRLIASLLTQSDLMPIYVWAVVGALAGLLGYILAKRRGPKAGTRRPE